MANNRIYLRCKNCGKGFFLGKCYGGSYFTEDDYYKEGIIIALNNFYEEHCFCNKGISENDLEYYEPRFVKEERDYENNFEIAYEYYYGKDEE